jgi:hypothetical protein
LSLLFSGAKQVAGPVPAVFIGLCKRGKPIFPIWFVALARKSHHMHCAIGVLMHEHQTAQCIIPEALHVFATGGCVATRLKTGLPVGGTLHP